MVDLPKCGVPKCRRRQYLRYLGHPVCEWHWDNWPAWKLQEVLGIKRKKEEKHG